MDTGLRRSLREDPEMNAKFEKYDALYKSMSGE
jgi:hypothetical protein